MRFLLRVVDPAQPGGNNDILVGGAPEAHAAYIKSEIEKRRRVVKAAGIEPE